MIHTAYSLIFNFMLENCGPKPFSSSKLGRLFFDTACKLSVDDKTKWIRKCAECLP